MKLRYAMLLALIFAASAATGLSAASSTSTDVSLMTSVWNGAKSMGTRGQKLVVAGGEGVVAAYKPTNFDLCQKDSYMPALNANVVVGGTLTLATAGTLLYYGLTDVRAYMKANSLTGFQGFRTAVKAVALELKDTKPAVAYTLATLYGATAAMFASKLVGGLCVGGNALWTKYGPAATPKTPVANKTGGVAPEINPAPGKPADATHVDSASDAAVAAGHKDGGSSE